jgi:hypothetical protein
VGAPRPASRQIPGSASSLLPFLARSHSSSFPFISCIGSISSLPLDIRDVQFQFQFPFQFQFQFQFQLQFQVRVQVQVRVRVWILVQVQVQVLPRR